MFQALNSKIKMQASLLYIIRKLDNYQYVNGMINGSLVLKKEDIINIKNIISLVSEMRDSEDRFFQENDIGAHVQKNIKFTIDVRNETSYHDTFSSFIEKNKLKLETDKFYIKELDCLYDSKCSNEKVNLYLENIKLIELLQTLATYQNKVGSDLELFFYEVEDGGLKLKIDYNSDSLSHINVSKINELKTHFFNKEDKEERKQIFITEMIGLLKSDNSYSYLLQQWDSLVRNYEKAFKFYLSGFSFDKIKTSSTVYFQQFTDRVFEQVNKATVNIFIVPSVYVLMLKSFPLSDNNSILQSIVLLVSMFIFSLVMHAVLFNNMKEGLNSIEEDINKFKEKANPIIGDLHEELTKLKQNIDKQYGKILVLKWANWILFILFFAMLAYTKFSISDLTDLFKIYCQISSKN